MEKWRQLRKKHMEKDRVLGLGQTHTVSNGNVANVLQKIKNGGEKREKRRITKHKPRQS
jgi:short subunit dehydrogenase-like uncharacterized protein